MPNLSMAIAKEITYQNPALYWQILDKEKDLVFLDSASTNNPYARYSFLALSPIWKLCSKNNKVYINDKYTPNVNELDTIATKLAEYKQVVHPTLPPFQGGIAGFFSYDLGAKFEVSLSCAPAASQLSPYPDIAVALYDLLISFDHKLQRAWIVANPRDAKLSSQQHAQRRINWLYDKIQHAEVKNICIKKPITSKENITSNFSQQSYCAAVAKMQQYILSGDIFEVNLSQCFKCDIADLDVYRLYQRLRYFNPAPFAAYTNLANIHLLSSSPERFLRLSGSQVEARPIKGTINRSSDINTDYQNIQQLLNSEKDKAENTMIVDLMRNDLSKVALPHSVIVEKLCGLESYANVHHLVSVITATLAPQVSAIELLKNTFPGGSITGAPKIRAMQIIAEIEPHTRGPYCGSMGYIGFNGEMDLSILIRTIIYQNGKVTFHGGGAVTLNSEPLHEYQESMAKVATLFQALVACCN